MELSFKDLDIKKVNEVIKGIDFDTFLKGVFYIGNEIEQIHNELHTISKILGDISQEIIQLNLERYK